VIPVHIPPLRERRDDIPLLVQHFLDKFRGNGRPAATVSQEAMRRLMSYTWPGNVRQLENAAERAVAFGGVRGQIEAADLPPELAGTEPPSMTGSMSLPDEGVDLTALVANIERELIQRSLERTGGNKGQAAKLLNLKRTTLVEKLKRSGN
jgi:DNA-binding NtrC family response regulator